MITLLTQANAHLCGPALPTMYRLRQREFINRQGWDIPSYRGMEYDAYDNPATTYLIYQSETGDTLGVSRLYPTDRPYMISDIWPHFVTQASLPSSPHVFEGSRFAIDKTLPAQLRKRIKHEIVCAYIEFALERDIHSIIGVMPPGIWKAVFTRSGWQHETLGDIHSFEDGLRVCAAALPVSQQTLETVRAKTGISEPVLCSPEANPLVRAA